eukprot:11226894-Lingulodinium_polyedra.AAC.1
MPRHAANPLPQQAGGQGEGSGGQGVLLKRSARGDGQNLGHNGEGVQATFPQDGHIAQLASNRGQ